MKRVIEAYWEFHCPECGFGHHELGRLAADHEIYCIVCDHETGQAVAVRRWLADEPVPAEGSKAD